MPGTDPAYLDIPEGHFVSPQKLTHLIVNSFSDSELQDLCWEIRVDYESLPGSGKAYKARELVAFHERRQRLKVLVVEVLRFRPHVALDSLLTTEQVVLATPTIVPSTAVPRAGHETQMISQGLTALIKLLRSPEVRTAVVAFQTDFEAASGQIDLMNDYKQLHDLMQQLENRYFLLYNDQRRLPADDTAWDNILMNEPDLRAKIADLLEAVNRASFDSAEVAWTRQLERARDELHTAAEDLDLDSLQSATRGLSRFLNRQPSRINAQLVTTAANLRLDKLIEALTAVKQKLAAAASIYSQEVVDQLDQGVAALDDLAGRLSQLVQMHNALQDIDDELRRVEASLAQDTADLEDAWYDLEPMVADLCRGQTDEWAVELQETAATLGQALADAAPVHVRRHFRRFRSQVGRRFRQVDMALLALCQDMQKVGEPLDLLLRSFR